MNEKGVREIRRRFRPDKSMIGSVYGCYVNEDRKIVATQQIPVYVCVI